MNNPISTYRIQFNKDFTFRHLQEIIPYLQGLGVSTLYASPIFEAVPGSMHGYDVSNPHVINPEIGTEDEFRKTIQKLQEAGINWLQDIVPNHMAFHYSNVWLMDVLEKGQRSLYATFFDITWTTELFQGKLMVPFLEDTIEKCIADNKIKIAYESQRLWFAYADHRYPLHPRSYERILNELADQHQQIRMLVTQINDLHAIEDPTTYNLRWHECILQFDAIHQSNAWLPIETIIDRINNSPETLNEIAGEQHYRLCRWDETDSKINYRRFFTVNGLICLNMHDADVFAHYHTKIASLLKEGLIQGLRIDHIDGLQDPQEYLIRLRALAGPDTYIVIEKILEPGEQLPDYWPIQGTTGYDFLADVNNLFTREDEQRTFTKFYDTLTDSKRTVKSRITDKKRAILLTYMKGELENLARLFLNQNLATTDELSRITTTELKEALAEFLIQCPVYRYYGNSFPFDGNERGAIDSLLRRCADAKPHLTEVFNMLGRVFLKNNTEEYESRAILFYQRCMQFTGPLMAKGVEDTLMYTFNRFIGHNEVGDSPEFFGLSTSDFHAKMIARQRTSPMAMNTTSTHDTKRGEDVRTRLNILPELAQEWIDHVNQWRNLNAEFKQDGSPDANDEYFIYQTLLGTYTGRDDADYVPRLEEYFTKALREAKQHSDWSAPNEHYEEATKNFIRKLLASRTFLKSFEAFAYRVRDYGIVNSLAQLVLKFTCPGIPDVYQGTTLWDLTLVDPDNRRMIDFNQRWELLQNITQTSINPLPELWESRHDARIKLWMTHKLLTLRSTHADVFLKGEYIPLSISGKYKEHIIAFARQWRHSSIVVILPLYTAKLSAIQNKTSDKLNWGDTRVHIQGNIGLNWKCMLTGNTGKIGDEIFVRDLFGSAPFALLAVEASNISRAAGILLPLNSLPSRFGIGDLGPEAFKFADFLFRSGQTYWQLLPLNPTTSENGHSPYSSYSTMGHNILFISPEKLMAQGLLDASALVENELTSSREINYKEAYQRKLNLLEKAWSTFQTSRHRSAVFEEFIEREKYWLDDFSLYSSLRNTFNDDPWHQWPNEYKFRDTGALSEYRKNHDAEIKKIMWWQFQFVTQWQELKRYCEALNIKLFGDLPFYVSYDSVDVWANPELFSLDQYRQMTNVAGVPPDYFSETGQLWGMPVFDWDALKLTRYQWWINRVKKNLELYDVLRFDHFRAFDEYWSVPAKETTALNGEWKKGPGAEFFSLLKNEFGDLPFVAEDLGMITPTVYELRDQFGLPGMRILQYAFDESMSQSEFIPHHHTVNSVVYTGTHDNNTTRGWYRTDTSSSHRKRINDYFGRSVNEKTITESLIRLAYASVCRLVIIPMQDILNLDEGARTNVPSSTARSNWTWQLVAGQLKPETEENLLRLVRLFDR